MTTMPHYISKYVVVFALLVVTGHSAAGRELRPSDHGLTYQEDTLPPAQNDDGQQMLTFFGGATSRASPSFPLPEAQNINDTWWRVNNGGSVKSRDGGRRDHVRTALLVASAVCGLTGVVLLGVSGIIFLVRRLHKQCPKSERISSTSAPIEKL